MAKFDTSNVDVEHFLEALDLDNITKATQDEMRFSCPFTLNHDGGDESPSCYMNVNTGVFFCHGCKEKGTAVDFAAYVLSITPLESIRLLRQAYLPGGINPDARDIEREVQKILAARPQGIVQPKLSMDLLDRYGMDWQQAADNPGLFPPADYFLARGFTPLTLAKWDFGWDERSQRVIFAVFDETGELIGFKGRATDGRKPKYLVLGDGPGGGPYGFPRYYPSHVVFGADRYAPGIDQPLVVCEGELNAIATVQKTSYPAVAINGSFFQPWHAKVIRKIADNDQGVILFLDDDKAGRECVWGHFNAKGEWRPGIVELLSLHLPVSLALADADGKDAADMDEDEIFDHLAAAEDQLLVRMR